jgi:putative ABC transport system permease protein
VDVLRQVVARALRPVWIGAAAGLAAAAASARVLAGVVYDTDVREPATYVAVAATLLAAATLAAYLPARRAAAEDPAGALRGD